MTRNVSNNKSGNATALVHHNMTANVSGRANVSSNVTLNKTATGNSTLDKNHSILTVI